MKVQWPYQKGPARMRVSKLDGDTIQEQLRGLSEWSIQDGALTKTFAFADFVQAMQFVNRLADAAEAAQHHPDIDIRYSKVTIALTTHDSGGITKNDFALAHKAEAIAGGS